MDVLQFVKLSLAGDVLTFLLNALELLFVEIINLLLQLKNVMTVIRMTLMDVLLLVLLSRIHIAILTSLNVQFAEIQI